MTKLHENMLCTVDGQASSWIQEGPHTGLATAYMNMGFEMLWMKILNKEPQGTHISWD
jgi:hypothetical protein